MRNDINLKEEDDARTFFIENEQKRSYLPLLSPNTNKLRMECKSFQVLCRKKAGKIEKFIAKKEKNQNASERKKKQPEKVVALLTCSLPPSIISSHKIYLSSSKVINLEWFTQNCSVFDMELFSDFAPVQQIIFHKKLAVAELIQGNNTHMHPHNIDYAIRCLDSISSKDSHFLADLLRKFQINIKNQTSLPRKNSESLNDKIDSLLVEINQTKRIVNSNQTNFFSITQNLIKREEYDKFNNTNDTQHYQMCGVSSTHLDSFSGNEADNQLQNNRILEDIHLENQSFLYQMQVEEIKKKAYEVIEQLNGQTIFTFNIFIRNSQNICTSKISQGYSEGFLKMMGMSREIFSSVVMEHKGFEVFSGHSRLNSIIYLLLQELNILNSTYLMDEKAEVKTFDDFLLTIKPRLQFYPLNTSLNSLLIISHFDISIDTLIDLDNIRKTRNSISCFNKSTDFRHECQVSSFLDKFYPHIEQSNDI